MVDHFIAFENVSRDGYTKLSDQHDQDSHRIAKSRRLISSDLSFSSSCLYQDHVTILNYIVLSFRHDLALCLDLSLITVKLLQDIKVVDDDLDEGLLKVAVNDTSCLWSLGAIADGPLTNFVSTGCEETAEVEDLSHGCDGFWEGGVDTDVLALLGDLSVSLQS